MLDVVADGGEVEVPDVMAHEKAHEMVESFERSIRSQGMDPEQYYELTGTDHAAFEERVMPDAEDTVRKELVLDAVATAEGIVADEDEVMHEIGHLAEGSSRSRSPTTRWRWMRMRYVPMPEEETEGEPADEEVSVETGATESEEREEQQ